MSINPNTRSQAIEQRLALVASPILDQARAEGMVWSAAVLWDAYPASVPRDYLITSAAWTGLLQCVFTSCTPRI